MLQGTFETLSLPEVLGLLASARKTGALWLDAGPITGVVHLEDGHCRATEAGEQRGPVEDGSALLIRLVDVCFAVMRQDAGSFRFADAEVPPWSCADPVELSDAVVEVDRLLKQWREILRVIPSLECRPRLLDVLEVDEIVLDQERWSLLVAVDGRRTVRELIVRTGRPVMDVCHILLELVEAGAVGVIDPAAALPVEPATGEAPAESAPVEVVRAEPPAPVVPEPLPAEPVAAPPVIQEPVAPAPLVLVPSAPETDSETERTPASEPVSRPADRVASVPDASPAAAEAGSQVAASEGAEPADRGAFLRLFSGLRES